MKKTLLLTFMLVICMAAVSQNWTLQYTNFPGQSTGVDQICIVDQNIVWVKGFNGSGSGPEIRQFSMTFDGGATWSYGEIALPANVMPANIAAVSMDRAYCVAYDTSAQAASFWYTSDGGTTWDTVYGVMNNAPTTFANLIKFWNPTTGFCMGDPVGGEFDVNLTTNGGLSWVDVPAANLPDPLSGEYGYNGAECAAIGDNGTAAFITNKGRVYVTADFGNTWSVTPNAPFTSCPSSAKIYIANTNLMIAGNYLTGIQAWEWKYTTDGGTNWAVLSSSIPSFYQYAMCYVPGTGDNFVSTSPFQGNPMGVSLSEDGGLSWNDFTDSLLQVSGANIQCLGVGFYNLNLGWVGIYDQAGTGAGVILKYENDAILLNPANPDTGITGTPYTFTFTASGGSLPYLFSVASGTLPPGLILDSTGLLHGTPTLSGPYTFNVKVVDIAGDSAVNTYTCIVVGGSGIADQASQTVISLYPVPATSFLTIESSAAVHATGIFNLAGTCVYSGPGFDRNSRIDISELPAGMYFLRLNTDNGFESLRFVISR